MATATVRGQSDDSQGQGARVHRWYDEVHVPWFYSIREWSAPAAIRPSWGRTNISIWRLRVKDESDLKEAASNRTI